MAKLGLLWNMFRMELALPIKDTVFTRWIARTISLIAVPIVKRARVYIVFCLI
jgi:hypothetical protein